MRQNAIYLSIVLIAGLLFGSLALFLVARGTIDNPFEADAPVESGEDIPGEVPREPTDPDGPDLEGVPGVLWPAVTLEWALDAAPESRALDALAELAERKDAVGYSALVQLAEVLADEDIEDALIEENLRRALDLHYTEEVHRRLADYLLRVDEEAAVDEYMHLLPDPEVIDILSDSGASKELIGRGLFEGQHWTPLLDFLPDSPDAIENEFYRARALFETGDYASALEEFASLSESDYEGARWWMARSLESTGRTSEALEIYRDLGAEGGYRAGIILESRGERLEAARAFGSALDVQARWRGARIWDEEGLDDLALDLYLEVARESDSTLWDDAAYRAYLMLDDGDPRREDLLDLLRDRPAWMHRLDLEPHFSLRAELIPRVPDFLDRQEAYTDSGRYELAEIERRIGERLIDPGGKLYLALRHLEAGEYERAVRWGSSLVADRPCPAAYRTSFPRAFESLVMEAAAEFSVDPHLIWAVMREESRFRPAVSSWAGAMGLMQVMPDTGREIARNLGEVFDVEDLLDPETNIRFGAYYLRRMLDQYHTSDAALAAYNAGPGNAARWLGSPLGTDPDTFPTAVTFRETRLYITRVMDSKITYDWLYGEDN